MLHPETISQEINEALNIFELSLRLQVGFRAAILGEAAFILPPRPRSEKKKPSGSDICPKSSIHHQFR